jgi:hypothetical protein
MFKPKVYAVMGKDGPVAVYVTESLARLYLQQDQYIKELPYITYQDYTKPEPIWPEIPYIVRPRCPSFPPPLLPFPRIPSPLLPFPRIPSPLLPFPRIPSPLLPFPRIPSPTLLASQLFRSSPDAS